ncbi:MAG: alpha/beta hydrolase-fold protein, partial [Planctomycetota bacterium]
MAKMVRRWHSARLDRDVGMARWGHYGTPVLLFPTAGGDAEEVERFHLVGALWPLIEAGRIKVYSCDSIAGREWIARNAPAGHLAWLQNQFDGYVRWELVPAIQDDCGDPGVKIIVAGSSIGAFNAVATTCRHPDVVRMAIGMSGTYDLSPWLNGEMPMDFYYSSPLHYLPNLEEGAQL